MNTTASNKKSVSFAQYSGLCIIPKAKDINLTWYSSHDHQRFQASLVQDVKRVTRELQGQATMTPEQLCYECLGIEVLVNEGLARQINEKRRAHISAVLREQRLQAERGVRDIDKIAFESMKRSHWSKERAEKLAMAWSELRD